MIAPTFYADKFTEGGSLFPFSCVPVSACPSEETWVRDGESPTADISSVEIENVISP
jgi:hypothetical protein